MACPACTPGCDPDPYAFRRPAGWCDPVLAGISLAPWLCGGREEIAICRACATLHHLAWCPRDVGSWSTSVIPAEAVAVLDAGAGIGQVLRAAVAHPEVESLAKRWIAGAAPPAADLRAAVAALLPEARTGTRGHVLLHLLRCSLNGAAGDAEAGLAADAALLGALARLPATCDCTQGVTRSALYGELDMLLGGPRMDRLLSAGLRLQLMRELAPEARLRLALADLDPPPDRAPDAAGWGRRLAELAHLGRQVACLDAAQADQLVVLLHRLDALTPRLAHPPARQLRRVLQDLADQGRIPAARLDAVRAALGDGGG